jgi:hypothetical protein
LVPLQQRAQASADKVCSRSLAQALGRAVDGSDRLGGALYGKEWYGSTLEELVARCRLFIETAYSNPGSEIWTADTGSPDLNPYRRPTREVSPEDDTIAGGPSLEKTDQTPAGITSLLILQHLVQILAAHLLRRHTQAVAEWSADINDTAVKSYFDDSIGHLQDHILPAAVFRCGSFRDTVLGEMGSGAQDVKVAHGE